MTQKETVAMEEEVQSNEGKRCTTSSCCLLRGKGASEEAKEHAVKVREVREARRKRILARSSERLAYICCSSGAGAMDCTSSSISCSSTFKSPSTFACTLGSADVTAAAMDTDLCRYLSDHDSINQVNKDLSNEEVRGACEAEQEHNMNVAVRHGRRDAPMSSYAQSSGMNQACKSGASCEVVTNSTQVRSMKSCKLLSYSIFPDSYVKYARLVSAACTAILFFVAILINEGGHPDHHFFLICSPLACVVLCTSLLLLTGVYFLFSRFEQQSIKSLEANNGVFLTFVRLLFSVSLDCSISALLIVGGLIMLSKYFPALYCHIL